MIEFVMPPTPRDPFLERNRRVSDAPKSRGCCLGALKARTVDYGTMQPIVVHGVSASLWLTAVPALQKTGELEVARQDVASTA